MTANIDDQLFAWLKTVLESVSTITDIVGTNGICRDDWAASNKPSLPRIEYNPYRFSATENGDVYTGQFGITVVCDRAAGATYGGGDTPEAEGDIWTLESTLISIFSNTTPVLAGYGASKIGFSARRRPTISSDDVVTRRLNFDLLVYPSGGGTPLSGGDASLSGLSSNLKVVGWTISVDSGIHTDFTDAGMNVLGARVTKPIGRVQIWTKITGDGTVLFPAHGSRESVVYGTDADSSFTESTLIQRVQWVPSADQASKPQTAIIYGVIDNETSPVFTGFIP